MAEESLVIKYWKKFWAVVGHIGNLQTLWTLAVASGITTVIGHLISGKFQASAILFGFALSFVFLASWCLIVTIVQVVVPGYRRWRSPHSLVVIAHGGDAVRIELKHYGEPATWEVRGRMRRILDDSPNPGPVLRPCEIRRDNQRRQAMELRHEQCASILLAKIQHAAWGGGDWMEINDTRVPNVGAIVELEITATPALPDGTMRRCYRIARGEPARRGLYVVELVHPNEITVEEVQCD